VRGSFDDESERSYEHGTSSRSTGRISISSQEATTLSSGQEPSRSDQLHTGRLEKSAQPTYSRSDQWERRRYVAGCREGSPLSFLRRPTASLSRQVDLPPRSCVFHTRPLLTSSLVKEQLSDFQTDPFGLPFFPSSLAFLRTPTIASFDERHVQAYYRDPPSLCTKLFDLPCLSPDSLRSSPLLPLPSPSPVPSFVFSPLSISLTTYEQIPSFPRESAHNQISEILAHRPSISVHDTEILPQGGENEAALITFSTDAHSSESAKELKAAFEKTVEVRSARTRVRGWLAQESKAAARHRLRLSA
jgi:hypothetical protein